MRSLSITVMSLCFAVCASNTPAATVHEWSKASGPGFASGVAADASGHIALVASGDLDFGQGMSSYPAPGQGAIARLASDGSVQWAKAIDAEPYAVAMDPTGNMVIVGAEHFGNAIDLGGGSLSMIGVDDVILVKLDEDGNHVWSRRIGDPQWGAKSVSIAVDGDGNTIFSGVCGPAADFGAGPSTSVGDVRHEFFVVKYSPGGDLVWQKRFGEFENYMQVACNADGDIVVSMELYKSVNLDDVTLTSTGISDIAIAKFAPDGTLQWTRQFGSPGIDYPTNIAIDAAGRIAFVGHTRTGLDFGGGVISQGVVVGLKSDGDYVWSRGFGETQPNAIAMDVNGNVIVTGDCGAPVDFGGGPLAGINQISGDLFAARYDALGNHLWSGRFGGEQPQDRGLAVAADPSGNFVFSGRYNGEIDFGGGPLPITADHYDTFVVKFGEGAPSTVSINRFDATLTAGAVDIEWDVSGTGDYTLMRRQDLSSQSVTVATGSSTQNSYHDASVQPGHSYEYQLVVQGADGSRHASSTASVSTPAAKTGVGFHTAIGPNAPNPFNPITSIEYTVGERMQVTIDIFDVSGKMVRRLQQGTREPGKYRAEWNGRDSSGGPVASGVYLYRFAGNSAAGTRKMVLLK